MIYRAAYMGVGNSEEALGAYTKALELEPENTSYRSAVEQARLRLPKPTSPPSMGAGGLDLAGLMSNPELMNMASRMMSDPEAMRNMMSNPNLQSMYPITHSLS